MYTNKDRVKVVIITEGFRVEGEFHLLVGARITDALNAKMKDFFALTDAKVFMAGQDVPAFTPGYLAVNREAIQCIFPVEEQ